jgi:hypothetical protein
MAAHTLRSGDEHFTVDDLFTLSTLVASVWTAAADRLVVYRNRRIEARLRVRLDRDWSVPAGTQRLVESLWIATRMLAGVVNEAEPDARAVIFSRPEILVGAPHDFAPRAALELILHAHDVCAGLQIDYEPPPDLCHRLREHTRPWPVWTVELSGLPLGRSDDPWNDLLEATGRSR